MFTIGPGFMQHKIRIENRGNAAPQLRGDYVKGYDRLSNGFALNEFFGFIYLGNTRLINFTAGLDFTQAFTENRRTINYDTGKHDSSKRFDFLFGIKIYWMIPFYQRVPNKYYYF